MKSPQEPPQESDVNAADDRANEPITVEFEQTLAEVERSLQDLKDRYQQVKIDQQQYSTLRQQQEQVQQEFDQTRTQELQVELKRIKQQLDNLEVNLESRLISESSLREIFWQVVRFSGLGIVVGWLLAVYVIKNPTPAPANPDTPTEQLTPPPYPPTPNP